MVLIKSSSNHTDIDPVISILAVLTGKYNHCSYLAPSLVCGLIASALREAIPLLVVSLGVIIATPRSVLLRGRLLTTGTLRSRHRCAPPRTDMGFLHFLHLGGDGGVPFGFHEAILPFRHTGQGDIENLADSSIILMVLQTST